MTIKQVEKIAKLARLELKDEEKAKFQKQLSAILDYVRQLEEVDTSQVEITSQATGLSNVLRRDEVKECDNRQEILKQAPEVIDGGVKVKSVF